MGCLGGDDYRREKSSVEVEQTGRYEGGFSWGDCALSASESTLTHVIG